MGFSNYCLLIKINREDKVPEKEAAYEEKKVNVPIGNFPMNTRLTKLCLKKVGKGYFKIGNFLLNNYLKNNNDKIKKRTKENFKTHLIYMIMHVCATS